MSNEDLFALCADRPCASKQKVRGQIGQYGDEQGASRSLFPARQKLMSAESDTQEAAVPNRRHVSVSSRLPSLPPSAALSLTSAS